MTLPPASQLAPVQQHALPAQADGQPLAKKRTRKVGRAYSLEEEDSLRRVVEESTRQMASQAESQESRDPFRIYGIHVGNEIRNLPASLWNEAKFQAYGSRSPFPALPSHLDGYVDAVSRHEGGNRPRSFQQRLKMGAGDQSPQPQRSTNQPATPPAKLAPPAQPPASAPARALSQAKKTLRHSPLPKLPKTDFKIVFRPGGGLNLCDVNGGMLLPLSCMAAELHYQEARNQDKLRINPYNNSYTISTPSEDRTKRRIDEIFQELVELNPSKSCTIVDARQLGRTKSILVTFINTKEEQTEIIIQIRGPLTDWLQASQQIILLPATTGSKTQPADKQIVNCGYTTVKTLVDASYYLTWDRFECFRQIFHCVYEAAKKDIYHANICPKNVVFKEGVYQLCGWQFSNVLDIVESLKPEIRITQGCKSPEACRTDRYAKVDYCPEKQLRGQQRGTARLALIHKKRPKSSVAHLCHGLLEVVQEAASGPRAMDPQQ
ncbi:hypothetical protein HPB47_014759 [Ixodes persulcatus]|uniref:Uncharacterized protein n=1 Tax=Ixodes persulcatus TaxID=34615 RepID=A0AC60QYR8_IXOPE|nr:hypothetical protein HPB47_014759 [Ixodes persulcatus]